MVEADKINTEVLVGKHNYTKLNFKILYIKIKIYGAFYKSEQYQSMLS